MQNLKDFILKHYAINATNISPANRGYWGETWRIDASCGRYFVKLDYYPRHQKVFQNSLPVAEYLCSNGIAFIPRIIKTIKGELHSYFDSAVMGVFEWINGKNVETNDTKAPEYQMICKIYPLTKPGFNIPIIEFSDSTAARFYGLWGNIEDTQVKSMLEQCRALFKHRAARLAHFAALCQKDTSDFFITHGDAGGNFFVGSNGRNYIVDWDEAQYAPPERDAWVMCHHEWAQELFNDTLRKHGIQYELRPERLAFYCYHMYFLYLSEFVEDFISQGMVENLTEYLRDSSIEEQIKYADKL